MMDEKVEEHDSGAIANEGSAQENSTEAGTKPLGDDDVFGDEAGHQVCNYEPTFLKD